MDKRPTSESVFYDQKEYTEETLNNSMEDSLMQAESLSKRNSVQVLSLEDNERPTEEWPLSCTEKEIPLTIPCVNLLEKYVSSKLVLHPGRTGLRPQIHSRCTLAIERLELLNLSFTDTLHFSRLFPVGPGNADVSFKIGDSETELERALELALLDMFEGERSVVTLHCCDRKQKLRDQEVYPVPCLRCEITLKRVTRKSCLLSLLSLSEEDKCTFALQEKARGVEFFTKCQYVEAFHRFAAGFKILMSLDIFLLGCDNDGKSKDVLKLFSTLCSNMAECQLKEDNPSQAISLCKKAISYDPCNVKALYRQALAAWMLGDVDQSNLLVTKVLVLDPNNVAAKRLYGQVQIKLQEYNYEYSKMMKRIFQ